MCGLTATERSQRFRERRPDYDKEWRDNDKARAQARERQRRYRARHPGLAAARSRRWREDNPDKSRESYQKADREKVRARDKVHYAVKTGRLERQPCEVCGSTETHAHHTDYSRPLDVRWLCQPHHMEEHRV